MIGYKMWAIASLIIYFVVLLLVSLRKSGSNETKEDFFMAGRSMPAWALTLTFTATWFGGTSAIVAVDQAYAAGVSAWWILGSPSLAAAFVLIFFAKAIRNVGALSQNEIIEKRYNKTAAIMVNVIVVWYMLTFASAQSVSLGKFFSGAFNTTYLTAVIIGVVIVALYTTLGGFRAVVLTDVIQFGLLTLGIIIMVILVFKNAGGWETIRTTEHLVERGDYFNFFANFRDNFFFLLSFGLAWIISADGWQRIGATKSAKDAKKIPIGVIFIFVPLYILVTLVGVGAGALYATAPEGGLIIAITEDYLHPFFGVLVFLGIAAAVMSTMSTAINSGALYVTDFYSRYINVEAPNKKLVSVAMLSTIVLSLLTIVIAVRIPDALSVLWMSSDILAAGVVVPLLASFIWRRGTALGAVSSIAAGSIFVLYNFFIDMGIALPRFWPSGTERILYGVGIGLLTFIIVSLLTKPEYEKADQFLRKSKVDVVEEK